MAVKDFSLEFEFRGKKYNDAERGLRILGDNLKKKPEAFVPILKTNLLKYLKGVGQGLSQRHGVPYPGGTTSNTLSKRSGRLAQAIKQSARVRGRSLEDVEGRLSAPGYARIHETGGVIRAKRSKYLTIPLPAALKPNGTPIKRSARQWSDTFVARSKKGNLIIFQKRGSDIVPLYVLKREVYIRPRLGMGDALEDNLPYFVDEVIDAMAKEVLNG